MKIAYFCSDCTNDNANQLDKQLQLNDISSWLALQGLDNIDYQKYHYLNVRNPKYSVAEIMSEVHLMNFKNFDHEYSPENLSESLVGWINIRSEEISEVLSEILTSDMDIVMKAKRFNLSLSSNYVLDDEEMLFVTGYLNTISQSIFTINPERHIFIDPKDPHKVFAVDEMQYIYIKVCRYLSTILFKSLG